MCCQVMAGRQQAARGQWPQTGVAVCLVAVEEEGRRREEGRAVADGRTGNAAEAKDGRSERGRLGEKRERRRSDSNVRELESSERRARLRVRVEPRRHPRDTGAAMKRVYLDQNMWIRLARVANGKERNEPIEDALRLMATARDRGLASFPLSGGHYFETWKRTGPDSRRRLARVMASYSRFHTLAAPYRILPAELDRALQQRFDRPARVGPLQPFGYEAAHALGQEEQLGPAAAEIEGLIAEHDDVPRGQAKAALEFLLLSGPPIELPAYGIEKPPSHVATKYRDAERAFAQQLKDDGTSRAQRERAIIASSILDIHEPLNAALARAGISWQEFYDLGAEGLTEFVFDLPTRAALVQMRRRKHENPGMPWEANDLSDLAYISTATAYCDIVITEKRWQAILQRDRFAQKLETRVLSKLEDLAQTLITA